jgi:hypothetical protein
MFKRIFIGCLFLLFIQKSIAQFDTIAVKQNILNQSDSMFIAFKNNDWDKFSNYMHPTILTQAKGKEAFIEFLENQMKELKNLTFTNYKQAGNIQVISTKNTLQCVVIYGMEMLIDSTVASGASTTIGESADNGITWKFIRNNSTSLNQIYSRFPWLSKSLKIAKEEQYFGVSLTNFLKTYKPAYLEPVPNTFGVRRKITTRKKIN